jgi:hypothetical protein
MNGSEGQGAAVMGIDFHEERRYLLSVHYGV